MAKKKKHITKPKKTKSAVVREQHQRKGGQHQHQHIIVNIGSKSGKRTRSSGASSKAEPSARQLPPPQYNLPVSLDTSPAFQSLFADLRNSLAQSTIGGRVTLATGERQSYKLGEEPISRIPIFDSKPVERNIIRLPNEPVSETPSKPAITPDVPAPIMVPEKKTAHLAEMVNIPSRPAPEPEPLTSPTHTLEAMDENHVFQPVLKNKKVIEIFGHETNKPLMPVEKTPAFVPEETIPEPVVSNKPVSKKKRGGRQKGSKNKTYGGVPTTAIIQDTATGASLEQGLPPPKFSKKMKKAEVIHIATNVLVPIMKPQKTVPIYEEDAGF